MLFTFGLFSRSKGIELMLNALPTVVRAHPEVGYIILGATHPPGEGMRVLARERFEHALDALVQTHPCVGIRHPRLVQFFAALRWRRSGAP